jgi:hypothetical protein
MKCRLVGLAIAGLTGCGSDNGPQSDGSFRGHFSTNATTNGDHTLAIYATSQEGVVTGYGWVGVPGLPSPPIEPLIVTGQQVGRAVSLTLASANSNELGILYGIFTGANEGGELHGTLSRSSQTLSSTFTKADTTATGQFDLTTAGVAVLEVHGKAGFKTAGGLKLELLRFGDSVPILTLLRSSRPAAGTSEVGTTLSALLQLPGLGAVILTSGTLTIGLSNPLTLIGQLVGQGSGAGGPIEITARFSAGCPTVCQ